MKKSLRKGQVRRLLLQNVPAVVFICSYDFRLIYGMSFFSAKEETFDSEELAREVEKIIESEDKVEEMTKLEKRERVRRLSEGLDDEEDDASDESTDEIKCVTCDHFNKKESSLFHFDTRQLFYLFACAIFRSEEPKNSIIRDLFGTDLVNSFKCRCGNIMSRPATNSLFDLVYPDITGGGMPNMPAINIP